MPKKATTVTDDGNATDTMALSNLTSPLQFQFQPPVESTTTSSNATPSSTTAAPPLSTTNEMNSAVSSSLSSSHQAAVSLASNRALFSAEEDNRYGEGCQYNPNNVSPTSFSSLDALSSSIFPHFSSDFTVPTSNRRRSRPPYYHRERGEWDDDGKEHVRSTDDDHDETKCNNSTNNNNNDTIRYANNEEDYSHSPPTTIGEMTTTADLDHLNRNNLQHQSTFHPHPRYYTQDSLAQKTILQQQQQQFSEQQQQQFAEQQQQRRSIFPTAVQTRNYHGYAHYGSTAIPTLHHQQKQQQHNFLDKDDSDDQSRNIHNDNADDSIAWLAAAADGVWAPIHSSQKQQQQQDQQAQNDPSGAFTNAISTPQHHQEQFFRNTSSSSLPLRQYSSINHPQQQQPSSRHNNNNNNNNGSSTRHAQSLLLGLALAALWSSSNLMAPNLTAIANDFGYSSTTATTHAQRDMYFGSILSLVMTVASIPLATVIGLAADNPVPTRPTLLVLILLGGAAATWGTGQATQYWQVVATRWCTGGCMAGSIPVAFSLVSDWFDVTERNVACSGATACMGMGVIVGQVWAGVSSAPPWSYPWWYPFTGSAILQAVAAMLCARYIEEPVRGGTEQALQAMLRAGIKIQPHPNSSAMLFSTQQQSQTNEDTGTTNGFGHKSTPASASFVYASLLCRDPIATNSILLWQGFFSSVPWGVMFVFLNDFLLQERGFSEPDATFLVAVFGVGSAAGGIIGGGIGHLLQQKHSIDGGDKSGGRWILPLFMSFTTLMGIFPFVALLNSHFTNARGLQGILYAGLGGLIASLPSVNVRPCLMDVNPPATRGTVFTTANLLNSLGRGVGPCCIPLIQRLGGVQNRFGVVIDRKFAFNVTVRLFTKIESTPTKEFALY